MMDLKAILKTTPKYIKILADAGITSVKDFLQYFPRAYEDRSTIRNLNELIFNEKGITATKGQIVEKKIYMRGGRRIYDIKFVDPVGNKGYIIIFNSGFMASKLHEDKRYIIVGKPVIKYNKIMFSHPDVVETEAPEEQAQAPEEQGEDDELHVSKSDNVYNSGRIFPIYPELMGIKPGWFAQKMRNLMDKVDTIFSEYLPNEFIDKFGLMGVQETIKAMHYPDSFDQQKQANLRIFFDRLLRIQLYSLMNRNDYQAGNSGRIGKRPEESDESIKRKNGIIEKILRISTEIHIKYGNTLTEKQYGKLIEAKLQKEGIFVQREKNITIKDDGITVGTKYMDIIVDNKIVVELKNTPYIHKQDLKQTRAYLDLGNYETGLLINFGESKINIARLEKDYIKNSSDFSGNSSDVSVQPDREIIKEIIKSLPFELTMAQKKVIKHITENIHEPKPMLRLLQGDVGSGKTVVAAASAYYTYKKFGGQSVFLAPLEVLANQHYKTLAKLLLPLGLRVELLTGSVPKAQKDKIKQDLLEGRIHTLIGTHAVIQEDVIFKQLQFVVIDEQHKFGVRQRAFFKRFGAPHILQMSATPIPRSMALAFFGEFDVSIIDEMPIGRKPIITKVISEKEYLKLKPWVLDHIIKGQKVFIVTPLIEESEKMEELKAATTIYEETKRRLGEEETSDGNVNFSSDKENQNKLWKDDDLTQKIIGIALKVHKTLGPKLKEQVYRNAMLKLLEKEGLKVEKEKKISYTIEGENVGYGMIDLVVEGKVAIELKSLPRINPVDYKQLRAYIQQSNEIDRGLLMNFGPGYFDFRRINKDIQGNVSKSPLRRLDPSRIGLLHGKMSSKDKEAMMQDFKTGKICLLVSTTVIEVGVDIPEATIMVIKNAERFGLSQLHQLRGRIGRSDIQSYCFLETKSKASDIGKRLKAMEDTNDGFKLAELDLQNRGAGEILGTMQSGESDIPLEILSDLKFLEDIQEGARRLLEKYPKLDGLPGLKKYLEEKMGDVLA